MWCVKKNTAVTASGEFYQFQKLLTFKDLSKCLFLTHTRASAHSHKHSFTYFVISDSEDIKTYTFCRNVSFLVERSFYNTNIKKSGKYMRSIYRVIRLLTRYISLK